MGCGGVWVQLLGDERVHTHVILVLHKYIWNVLMVFLILPALGFHLRRMVYLPGSTLGECFSSPCVK